MVDMKNFRIATSVALLTTAIFTVWGFTNGKPMPQETKLVIWASDFVSLPLPAELSFSYWWYLLYIPFILVVVFYSMHQEDLIGSEPRGSSVLVTSKHSARLTMHILTTVSLCIVGGAVVLYALFNVFTGPEFGPVSGLVTGLLFFMLFYGFMGFFFSFAMAFFGEDTYNMHGVWDKESKRMYRLVHAKQLVLQLMKLGLVRAMPLAIGSMCAFAMKLFISDIRWYFRKKTKKQSVTSVI